MDEPAFWERIGAGLAGGAMAVYGAVKVIGRWRTTTRLERESWENLQATVDAFVEEGKREREQLGVTVGDLVAVSKSQGEQIVDLRIEMAELGARVSNIERD